MHLSDARRLSVGLLASALALAPLPTNAQDRTAEDLGVMSISLGYRQTSEWLQNALQVLVLRTKQASAGSFLSLLATTVFGFLMPSSMPFGDRDGYSMINTDVASGFSTSTRLGYRWLNSDRSWMYGLNAGYDGRSLKSAMPTLVSASQQENRWLPADCTECRGGLQWLDLHRLWAHPCW